MNRNAESHFSVNPVNIDMQRSIFNRSCQHKTTFNTGDLIPIYVDEVLPGDTFKMDMSTAIRMATPIFPIMDNLNVDFYYFFVPNRLVWEHWREFNGENRTSAWEQQTEYEVPQLVAPATTGWTKGTIADYFGIPTKIPKLSVNALPFRAYCLIWNEWFRDQNVKDPCNITMDETTLNGTNSGDYVTNAQLGALPLKAAKYHDYFTSQLPEPQKGTAQEIQISMSGTYPVYGNGYNLGITTGSAKGGMAYQGSVGLTWLNGAYGVQSPNTAGGSGSSPASPAGVGVVTKTQAGSNPAVTGLVTDMSGAAPVAAFTINQLRQSFAIQRLFEKDARGGTRYTEIIRSHFGVISPDARQQRPEYLGGTRVPINIDQVLQTSGSYEQTGVTNTPQGTAAAYSLTNMAGSMFTKSFTEHGYIIGLAVVRTEHTYQQGLERMWSRKKRFDFYWPSLANIGEQAILNKEIYAQGPDTVDTQGNIIDEQAMDYQEAWAEYRYKPDRVSGQFRSNLTDSLDSWHLADYYTALPTLSSGWIDETEANVDRVIATQDEDQFIADFYFKSEVSRPMPLYSIPGLMDHH